jgi:CPA2 family monovalent cation:H+ antiporter-2
LILAATRDAARLFLELGTVTVVLAVGARLAARTGFSSIPLFVAGIVLGALAPPTLDDALVTTLSEVGIVLLLFTLGLEYSALELASGLRSGVRGGIVDLALNSSPGFAIGLLMGWGLLGALVLGGITYVSSSGIVAKVVSDLGRLTDPRHRGCSRCSSWRTWRWLSTFPSSALC